MTLTYSWQSHSFSIVPWQTPDDFTHRKIFPGKCSTFVKELLDKKIYNGEPGQWRDYVPMSALNANCFLFRYYVRQSSLVQKSVWTGQTARRGGGKISGRCSRWKMGGKVSHQFEILCTVSLETLLTISFTISALKDWLNSFSYCRIFMTSLWTS